MKAKMMFIKILECLCMCMISIAPTSVCGMGNEEMPESLKKLR